MVRKKLLSLSLAASMIMGIAGTISGCGKSSGGGDTEFSVWLYKGIESTNYSDYNDNPALQYALKNYSPEGSELSFDFWIPPAGTANDNYSNMIGSGEYADIIQNTIGDSPKVDFDNGISIDLTEYVKENMPNYLKYIEEHPEVRDDAVTEIDGEDHYLSIVSFNENYPDIDWGFEYRRDWIAKYGKNPETGEPFAGGYTDPDDPDSWEDNVVFPSGETDPVYISDWEWMFEIFEKAYADLGINDSYCISIQSMGYCLTGDLNASFGGGASATAYRNLDNKVIFGPETEEFRAYLECMNQWYRNGWLDPVFNERTSDMFYSIDSTNVYQGKVGMWFGVTGQLIGRMDTGDKLTDGICVYGAATPINDIYGDESTKNKTPYCAWGGNLRETEYIISVNAEDKDIASLLKFFDSFYTEEGALLKTLGLSSEQASTLDSTFYADKGLTDGAYTEKDGKYVLNPLIKNDSGDLGDAVRLSNVPGILLIDKVDNGYSENYQHSLDQWKKYTNYGYFGGTVMVANMTDEDTSTVNDFSTKYATYASQAVPEFITGASDPSSDADWEKFITMLGKYNYQPIIDIYQKYADMYPIIKMEG